MSLPMAVEKHEGIMAFHPVTYIQKYLILKLDVTF